MECIKHNLGDDQPGVSLLSAGMTNHGSSRVVVVVKQASFLGQLGVEWVNLEGF